MITLAGAFLAFVLTIQYPNGLRVPMYVVTDEIANVDECRKIAVIMEVNLTKKQGLSHTVTCELADDAKPPAAPPDEQS